MLKLQSADFKLSARSHALSDPPPRAAKIFATSLHAFATRGRRNKFRVIGIAVFCSSTRIPRQIQPRSVSAAFDIDTEKQRRGLNGTAWCF
jgi:hypothetical protein